MVGHQAMTLVGFLLLATAVTQAQEPAASDSAPVVVSEQDRRVEEILNRWAKWNAGVKRFECDITCWRYDPVFGSQTEPAHVDRGRLYYAAPHSIAIQFDSEVAGDKWVPIDPQRAGHWIFDGTRVWFDDPLRKESIGLALPSGVEAKQIIDGPLSFGVQDAVSAFFVWLFGYQALLQPLPMPAATAELKQTCNVRINTPHELTDEIWLEVTARSKRSKQWVVTRRLILRASDASPMAVQTVACNCDDVRYQFDNIRLNESCQFANDVFQPSLPPGWRKITEEPPIKSVQPKPLANRASSVTCPSRPLPASQNPRS